MKLDDLDSTENMARAAATVRLAGELMESSGVRALHVTHSWKPGPRSANLEPHGGARYETIEHVDGTKELVEIPSDRTGEAVLNPDGLARDHDRLKARLVLLHVVSDEVVHLLRRAVPNPVTALRPDDMTLAQVSIAGWCTSCWADGGYCEPVALQPNGQRRYKDHCLWCGRFMAAHDGTKPGLDLIKARHRGDRITQQMIDQSFANIEAERQQAKAARKKKKRKAA